MFGNYHIRGDWKLWEGVEVEGRFSGAVTLFVGDIAEIPKKIFSKYAQVFFNPVFLLKQGYAQVLYVLEHTNCIITLSLRENMMQDLPRWVWCDRIHIMYCLDIFDNCPDSIEYFKCLEQLRDNDTIRINLNSSKFENFQATKKNLWLTKATDYDSDKKVI